MRFRGSRNAPPSTRAVILMWAAFVVASWAIVSLAMWGMVRFWLWVVTL